jgi:putative DNA primase/helicase
MNSNPAKIFAELGNFTRVWQQPTPIESVLKPVEKFDRDLLPEPLANFVCDIAERTGAPHEFPMVAVLTALSALASKRHLIKPKRFDDWTVSPNLFGALIGRPSTKKSPSISAATAPLQALNRKSQIAITAAREAWQLTEKVRNMGKKASEIEAAKVALKNPEKAREILTGIGDDVEAEPKAIDFVVNDSTVEAVQIICQNSGAGVLVLRDELSGWLASLDKSGQEHARAFFLESWNGTSPFAVHRVTRERVTIDRLAVSVLGGIQPAAIANLIHAANVGGRGDDGLIQRFSLLVWPDAQDFFTLVDRTPDYRAAQDVQAIFDRLASDVGEITHRFDDCAQIEFLDWLQTHESKLRSSNSKTSVEAHLGKYAKLAASLALIFKLCRDSNENGVSNEDLVRALALCEFFESHAQRVYCTAPPAEIAAQALASKIETGLFSEPMTAREIVRRNWSGLGDVATVRSAIPILIETDWLQAEARDVGDVGRPPTELLVPNPLGRTKS